MCYMMIMMMMLYSHETTLARKPKLRGIKSKKLSSNSSGDEIPERNVTWNADAVSR